MLAEFHRTRGPSTSRPHVRPPALRQVLPRRLPSGESVLEAILRATAVGEMGSALQSPAAGEERRRA